MNSHIFWMVVFSLMVSLVFTFLIKEGAKERIKYFFYLFGSFVLISILASWLMYSFPF
ncbi:MAG: hypothetical protein ABIG68_00130 [Acidobacteriota bacterium]